MKIPAPDFNLEATLDSGQVFGFTKQADGSYEGTVRGSTLRLSQNNGSLHVVGLINEQTLRDYLDLDRDLAPVYQILQNDPKLFPAYQKLKGLRLIRQDAWEALVCFIISSNNNVKRIQGIWRNLSEHYDGFPTAGQLAKTQERTLRRLGLGYRAPFLKKTSQFIHADPQTLEAIRRAPYGEAVERVIAFPGIGPKVADCVLLYGFHKLEAFPVDVWILRVMRKLYFNKRQVPENQVHTFGQKKWGSYAGYIQQYLFHSARTGEL